jgi:hypothetical protein
MDNAELIEIRLVNKGATQYSYLVNCDYNGQDLLDIVTEELANKSDGYVVEAVPFRLLTEDGAVRCES